MKGPAADSALRAAVLDHFDRRGRDLPWRSEADPYRILVSEIMLQQTRVETVKRYYGAWLERFPDLRTLAEAPEDDVLKAWEGLGYYRRARHLHGAAKLLCDRGDGAVPSDYDALRALPGVGAYTAGAVASIAFGVVAPAVDGTVRRVLARLRDEPEPTDAWLRDQASALIDPERPGDWNQALMELGATICTPRAPACARCPVERGCLARAAGTQADRPRARARPVVEERRIVIAVFERRGRVLLTRRPAEGLLGGMWAFPEEEGTDRDPVRAIEAIAARHRLSLATGDRRSLPAVEHRFTHLHAVYQPIVVRARRTTGTVGAEPRTVDRWVGLADADTLALPVAQRAILTSWSRSRRAPEAEPAR